MPQIGRNSNKVTLGIDFGERVLSGQHYEVVKSPTLFTQTNRLLRNQVLQNTPIWRRKKVTKQLNPLVILLTNIRSTLKLGTPKTFFNWICEFKDKLPIEVIGAFSPLGNTTGGMEDLVVVSSKCGEDVMWFVAPLSINHGWHLITRFKNMG